MTLDQMLQAIFPPAARVAGRPSHAQRNIIEHRAGPAWVLAGPGSGKTETLALLILRLIFVDGVPPEAIFATTFTEKAARNLDDRISDYRGRLARIDPSADSVDTSKLRLGTLHGLCNDVLQEFRAENYQNVRLMDKFETAMFINEHVPFVKRRIAEVRDFWRDFHYVLGSRWNPDSGKGLQWQVAVEALATLFARIAEDNVDVDAMRRAGGSWQKLAELYDEYLHSLESQYRCDFSQLQRRFLGFLKSPLGAEFTGGNAERPAIQWVIVDEYQDTNLVQEAIYLKLAGRNPHNLVVVGDDDQAMYRFRGGSVECMVTFDDACAAYLSIPKNNVRSYPLADNYRSHPAIVEFCESYITSFREMSLPGARAPGKRPLVAASGVNGTYHALGIIEGKKAADAPAKVAELIADLVANNVVSDYSECCILLKSTKEGPHNAGHYVNALRARGIPVYNPRSGNFLEQPEVLTLLGALLAFVDPEQEVAPPPEAGELFSLVADARDAYASAEKTNGLLRGWLTSARRNLAAKPDAYLPITLQEVMYLLLAFEPFRTWQARGATRLRLAKITGLVEAYASLPVAANPKVRRGSLRVASDGAGVKLSWRREFCDLFLGYLSAQGVNDEEDDDVVVPHGAVPIMTMHQAKGLEFPFVFVGHMADKHQVSTAHTLEDAFSAFPGNPSRVFTRPDAETRARLDHIRRYYVAYSRAQYGLMFVGMASHFKSGAIPCGESASWLRNRVNVL